MTTKKPATQLPPADTLRKIFHYHPTTGKLFWKVRPREHFQEHYAWIRFNSENAQMEAGILMVTGYLYLKFRLLGKKWMVPSHRVILEMEGPIPDGMQPDHINGIKTDNRRVNLRLATCAQNCANRSAMKSRKDQSMPKGVSRANAGKFHAHITANGKTVRLGRFPSPELAHQAYCEASDRLHGEFSRKS